MRTNDLVATGLNTTQAQAYGLLLKHGEIIPTLLAKRLGLTRSNAYKVLDQLNDMGLAHRKEIKKKLVYYPGNPLALTSLVAEQRNVATAREEAVKRVMDSLLSSYHEHTEQPNVTVATGKQAVIEAYHQQINLLKAVYFLRSRADIPSLGFDVMHEIRIKPARHNQKRYGITPDMTSGPINPAGDDRSNLDRTWIKKEDYDAPVEWSVSGSTLLIVLFGSEPHAITIDSPVIAEAFMQIWKLMNSMLKSMPDYKNLPRTTKEPR